MKPRKPLTRRTPMPRGTTPLRRTELKRGDSQLKRTGFKAKARDLNDSGRDSGYAARCNGPTKPRIESSEIPKPIRDAVLARDGYSCQRCGRYLMDTIRYGLQHRRPRGAGGSRLLHTMANLVTLCGWVGDAGTCTDEVEERDRVQATADGWLLPKRLARIAPEEWPVLRWAPGGAQWQQPGDGWSAADPHPRQVEMGGGRVA